ncbi:MAG: HisA/HisF-related TIM barrel protein [Spirochaetes bacterium]|nr:HisA/HisF-related TIM barrel protein [Spirochaetota bacterium]
MVIIPAIDLLGGSCVRLYQGNYETAVRYPRNPVEQATYFADCGVRRIHIVDLDAARGQGNNRSWIQKIRQAVPCVLEVGGGIRTEADVHELLDLGVQRLVLGTVFIRDPDTVCRWVHQYGNLFLAGIDARGGIVRVSGWQEDSMLSDTEAALLAQKIGMCGIIYTNIERDGTLKGPDAAQALRIAEISHLAVILSGGISSHEDIHRVAQNAKSSVHTKNRYQEHLSSQIHGQPNWGIVGIIIGKAFYEGNINLSEILLRYPQPEQMPW